MGYYEMTEMALNFLSSRINLSSLRYFASQVKTDWEPVIGLEVHAQINSNTKLFSSAGTNFFAPVNSEVSLFDAAIPGTLPVLNKAAVISAVKTALALNANIEMISWFDRKHYFYSDLPAGYQITQQRHPIATGGYLKFPVISTSKSQHILYKTCHIKQIQLEQDSGRSLHDEVHQRSLIDLNRAGIGLMEIVFEPEISSEEEAVSLVKELILILRTLETCDCRLEEGSLRVDANISVRKCGEPYGTRTEIKNLNSLRCISNAICFEINRQIKTLEAGKYVVNETRSYDSSIKATLPMRDKEDTQDYRFMPEPNLPPLRLCNDDNYDPELLNISEIEKTVPTLPEDIRKELVLQYGLSDKSALIITSYWELLPYSLEAFKIDASHANEVAKVILNVFLEVINKEKLEIQKIYLRPETLVEITKLRLNRVISTEIRDIIIEMILKGDKRSPLQIIEDNDWTQISDKETLKSLCEIVIKNHPKEVKAYTKGKKNSLQKIATIIKQESNNRADMSIVVNILVEILGKSK